jgi:phenylacetate-CoA ligase
MASLYRGVPVTGIKKLALNIINWPQEVIRFDATNMTIENIKKFIDEIKIKKPDLIHGYVGAVDAVANYILENNIRVPSPKVLWLTAAPVTKIQEDKISKAFNAPVCDQYGCSEQYFISCECPEKEGLHVFEDTVKVEFLDDDDNPVENNTYGNLVFTNLEEYGFPLIRYKNGDRSRFLETKCSCGRVLPLMDKVKGRVSDNIYLPNKNIMSGEYLTTMFDDYTDDVKQFQIIQKEDYSVTIKIVFHKNNNVKQIVQNIYDDLQKRIQYSVDLKLEQVSEIISEKGKLQFIKSELRNI